MARRSKGEGSITQRKDGSWQGALQVECSSPMLASSCKINVLDDLQCAAVPS